MTPVLLLVIIRNVIQYYYCCQVQVHQETSGRPRWSGVPPLQQWKTTHRNDGVIVGNRAMAI